MGCSRQEYYSGYPFPSPGDLPDPGIEPGSPALQTDSLWSEPLQSQFSHTVVSDPVTLWTAAHQAFLSIANSRSLLKLISIKSVIPPNHLVLCCPPLILPLSFPASGSFPMSQLFASGGQSIGASASVSVLPMNVQDRFPLGLTGLISVQSK